LLNIPFMMSTLWRRLLGVPSFSFAGETFPISANLVVLGLACIGCVAMLNARIRAREVVRG
jgi:hypothetical protein